MEAAVYYTTLIQSRPSLVNELSIVASLTKVGRPGAEKNCVRQTQKETYAKKIYVQHSLTQSRFIVRGPAYSRTSLSIFFSLFRQFREFIKPFLGQINAYINTNRKIILTLQCLLRTLVSPSS